jgi:hypothetical protein
MKFNEKMEFDNEYLTGIKKEKVKKFNFIDESPSKNEINNHIQNLSKEELIDLVNKQNKASSDSLDEKLKSSNA